MVHQTHVRKIKHHKINEAVVKRLRCKKCKRTFRHYPQGVSQAQQTKTLKAMSVILYILGLSYDSLVSFFFALDTPLSKGTLWNNMQDAGEKAHFLRKKFLQGKIKICGLDTTIYKVKGKEEIVLLLSDILLGKTIEVEVIENRKAFTLKRKLTSIFNQLGVEVVVTDDAEEMEALTKHNPLVKRQLCLTHLKKATSIRIKKLEKETRKKLLKENNEKLNILLKDLKRIRKLMDDLPPNLGENLKEIHLRYKDAPFPKRGEKASVFYQMRLFTLRLWQRNHDILHFRKYGIDGTNNTTERLIGLNGKIRYKSMRGFKSKSSLNNFLQTTSFLWDKKQEVDEVDLSCVS